MLIKCNSCNNRYDTDDFDNCPCEDCDKKCDCNLELRRCQQCNNFMAKDKFYEYYGHCKKCRQF